MFIKQKYKLLRKYDCDIWNYLYLRRRKNKFFTYFRLSIINKIQHSFKTRLFFLSKNKRFFIFKKISSNINKLDLNYYKLYNFRRFFKKSKYYVRRLFFKVIRFKFNKLESLFGTKSAYQRYKKKILSPFSRFKNHLKNITLFYNNLNERKLRKLGNKYNYIRTGGINLFLLNLESRLDSLLMRLNLGNRFFIRNLVRLKLIIVNNKIINLVNYNLKNNQIISFKKTIRKSIYKILLRTIKFKRFFSQPPYYIETNYRTLCFLIIPKLIDPLYIAYPFFFKTDKFITGLHTTLWGW